MENKIKQLEQQIKELRNRKPFQFINRKGKNPIPMFYQKVVKSHTDFQNAAKTKDIELFKLPSGGEIISCFMNVDIAFAGTGSYTISVGSSDVTSLLKAQDVMTTGLKLEKGTDFTTNRAIYNLTNTSSIEAEATADVNTDESTAGKVTFYFLYIIHK